MRDLRRTRREGCIGPDPLYVDFGPGSVRATAIIVYYGVAAWRRLPVRGPPWR